MFFFFFCQGLPASHGDILVHGSLTAQKEHARFLVLSIYCLMVKSWNTFGVATSPNVADLSTSLNAGQWNDSEHVVLPRHHHHSALCSLDFRSTKRAQSDVLSNKSSTKRRKKRGTLKALNPSFTSTKLSTLFGGRLNKTWLASSRSCMAQIVQILSWGCRLTCSRRKGETF